MDENINEDITPKKFNDLNFVSNDPQIAAAIIAIAERYLGIEPTSNSKS